MDYVLVFIFVSCSFDTYNMGTNNVDIIVEIKNSYISNFFDFMLIGKNSLNNEE